MVARGVLLLAALLHAALGECPVGHVHLGGSCFLFLEEAGTWDDAQAACVAAGAQGLASLEGCTDLQHLDRFLNQYPGSTGLNFWVGAAKTGDSWTWSDTGASLAYGAPFFDPRTPPHDVNCASITSQGGYLVPTDCSTLAVPLCESPIPGKAPPAAPQRAPECPPPFVAVGQRCVYINEQFLTWDGARKQCQALLPESFSDLAVMPECESFGDLTAYLEQRNSTFRDWLWVGARNFEQTGVFKWISGDYLELGPPFWAPDQPNNFQEKQECVMLWGTNLFYAADEDCTTLRRSVCEIGW